MRRSLTLAIPFLFAMLGPIACMGVDTGEQAIGTATPTPSNTSSVTPTPTASPTPTATPTPSSFMEVEPNNNHDAAQDLGGSGDKTFSGSCNGTNDDDNFKVTAAAGSMSVTLTWSDAAGDDMDLFISSYDYSLDVGDEAAPPGDSPASVTTNVPASVMYFDVFCFDVIGQVAYTGTVHVP